MIENKQQRPMLIATKFDVFCAVANAKAPPPHFTHHSSLLTPFLFDTNKVHRITILMSALMKTKEKQFSIRYKFAFRGTGLPDAGRHMLRCAGRGSWGTNHESQVAIHAPQLTTDLFSAARFAGDFLPGALRLGRGVPGDGGLAFPSLCGPCRQPLGNRWGGLRDARNFAAAGPAA
jgi:hypothetical protein